MGIEIINRDRTTRSPAVSGRAVMNDCGSFRQARIRAEQLWPRMTDLFGYKFTSQFGESPSDTWVRCLEGLTGRQIASGLQALVDDTPDWPPGAGNFRSLCLGRGKSLEESQHGVIREADRDWDAGRQDRLALEDKGKRERSMAAGEKALTALRAGHRFLSDGGSMHE